nr:YCF48-related protein [Algoriphagus marinus]
MRKFLLLFCLFFIGSISLWAQTWTRMQSWGLDFESINWVDSELGFIVGENLIIRTIDGGISWKEYPITFEGKLKDVDFWDKDLGVAVGENGLIFRTSDGGGNWIKISPPTTSNLLSIAFSNSTKIIAIGENGLIFRSEDAGQTWSSILSGSNLNLNDLFVVNQDTAFVASNEGKILRTYDGGLQWISINSGQSQNLKGITFSTALIGYAVGDQGTILKTINGGESWTAAPSNVTTELRKVSISPIDIRIITIVGENATALRSTNSGASFAKVNLGATNQRDLIALAFKPSSNLVMAIGQDGYLISSTNAGSSYTQRLAGIRNNFSGTDFKSDRAGLISGENGQFFLTTNGAVSLTSRPLPESLNQVSLDFWNTSFGYVSGEGGKMYRTGNSGSSWVSVPAQTSETINGFYLFAPSVAYIAGSNGYIARSFDSGGTWDSNIATNTSENLRDITFFDFQVGFAMGDNGQISWSNGGNVWENLPKLTSENLNALAKVDSSTAIIVGDAGVILKSEDKARTWRRIELEETENLNSVDFWDEFIGFVVGDNGKTLQTKDGGETWVEIPSGTTRNLTSVSAGNPVVAFAVGEDGTILNYRCVPPTDVSEVIGAQNSCLTMQKYSILDSPVDGSELVWRVDGGIIVAGQGSSEIEVMWTIPGKNGVFVSRQNFCGNGETSFMEVLVDDLASSELQITGDGKVCKESVYSYSVPVKSGVTYSWTVTGGEITSGQGSASILVEWSLEGNQLVSVTQENICGKSNPIELPILVTAAPPQPSEIVGESQTGLGDQFYEVELQNEVNFIWEISGEGIIEQGQGSNRVLVTWQNEGDFQLKVTPQNECNEGVTRVLDVNVNIITALPEKEITGIKIYPNPSSGIIFIEFEGSSSWESLLLVNSISQEIQSFQQTGTIDRIRIENLKKGLYIIQLQSKNSISQYKVIVN